MKPTFPINLLNMPFCQNGTKTIIPADSAASGRATLAQGFPIETQLPEENGGVAPNRLDFNGALYLSTSLLFWLQSGGQAVYQTSLNYPVPSMTYHDGILYWCLAENGPETAAGVVTPGTNEDVWINLLSFLAQSAGGSTVLGVPVGTIIMYPVATPPEGFFVCDGAYFSATTYPKLFSVLGRTNVPDMRGQFVRGYDPNAVRDPDGRWRGVGSAQIDAGRNITGTMPGADRDPGHDAMFGGCFYLAGTGYPGKHKIDWDNPLVYFDASRSWGGHVANEFRPTNISMQYCIKHD